MDFGSSNPTPSRRKTLDVSRLPSSAFTTPSKEKRYSCGSNQTTIPSSNTIEQLASIEESLKQLKADMNPLYQRERQGIRSLVAARSVKEDNIEKNSTKWCHKNDTAKLRTKTSMEHHMPPRYQRKHKGILESPDSLRDKKSRQGGCGTMLCTVISIVVVVAGNYWYARDLQKSWCERNLTLNFTSLNATIREHVYGQHILIDTVPPLVHGYITQEYVKPLALAFLGWTGVGKNFVGSLIGDHIRTKKRTVQKYIVPLHFPDTSGLSYKRLLQDWIIGNFSSCAVNLVIIDEIEKAPNDVMEGIEGLLERFEKLRLNSTKIIVLLLSSSGGKEINKFLYNYISNDLKRESVTNLDILTALKSTEADWFLSLHERGLIESVVPFLPLEKRHVAKCIEEDIDNKHNTCASPHVVAKVLDELTFFPQNDPVFSSAGCRKVGSKVDFVVDSIESGHLYSRYPTDE